MCRTTAKKLSSSDVSTNSDWFAAISRYIIAALQADESTGGTMPAKAKAPLKGP